MTDISALEAYAGQLSEAAAMASADSEKQHQYINGTDVDDVATESRLVPTIAKQARLSAEQATGLQGALADPTDPSKEPGKVGFGRDTMYAPGTLGVALKGAEVTPWEFADLLTYTPGVDPAGWDWASAFNASMAKHGYVALGFGAYGVLFPTVIKPGNHVKGKGPGHAGGTAYSNIFASRIIALPGFVGDAVFTSKVDSPETYSPRRSLSNSGWTSRIAERMASTF